MEASRTIEGHQVGVTVIRVRGDGTPAAADTTTSTITSTDTTFGTVHLGERFACQFSITNEGTFNLTSVHTKIELQTSTQRTLLHSDDPNATNTTIDSTTLCPNNAITYKVGEDIREVGVHVLVCTVAYINTVTGDKKFARKFFKFTVVNPLALRTKVTPIRFLDTFILEAQIHNVSGETFILEVVDFDPIPPVTLLDHSDKGMLEKRFDSLVVTDKSISLEHDQVYEYAFQFSLPPPTRTTTDSNSNTIMIGRLDIQWRSGSGESGRLQTGTLSYHDDDSLGDIILKVDELPVDVTLYKPFTALFILRNRGGKDFSNLRIVHQLPLMDSDINGLILLGSQEVKLGGLTAYNSTRCRLMIMATSKGNVNLSNLILYYQHNSIPHQIPLNLTLHVQ